MNSFRTGGQHVQVTIRIALLLLVALNVTVLHAQDTPSNRENEVRSLIVAVASADRREVLQATQYIYFSGLSDRRLAEAVNRRLLRDYRGLVEPNRVRFVPGAVVVVTHYSAMGDGFYGISLVRALASFGLPEFASTLQQVGRHPKKGGAVAPRVRKSAIVESENIEWHRRKNQLMADNTRYMPGEEPQVARLMTLLQSDDESYQRLALEWFDAMKIRNERMFGVIAHQVTEYAAHPSEFKSNDGNKAISLRMRILSHSENKEYRHSLEDVVRSDAHPAIKKRAQAALTGLLWNDDSDTDTDEQHANDADSDVEDHEH